MCEVRQWIEDSALLRFRNPPMDNFGISWGLGWTTLGGVSTELRHQVLGIRL